jgi:dinuclear metal center YbgI/SA1388 family protein
MRKVPRFNVQHITSFLDAWAPPQTQFSYDNVGLLSGDPQQPVASVLVTLDVTDAVIEEAIAAEIDLIVAHHPLIFPKITRVTSENPTGRMLRKLIKHDIALFVSHTNLDASPTGVSHMLAQEIGLTDIKILDTGSHSTFNQTEQPETPHGMGAIGTLPVSEPHTQEQFFNWISKRLNLNSFRFCGSNNRIKKVAVCGGAGVSLASKAIAAQADVFITADIKYHDYFVDYTPFLLLDIGHFESEQMMRKYVSRELQKKFSSLRVEQSKVDTNPMNTFVYKSDQSQNQPSKA